jgi:hypothetical protein
MKRNIKSTENEIVHQILFCELCFDICKSIKIIPGRGSDFLPYYYNLNFTKGLISLHSLLLSEEKEELSIKNYLNKYKNDFPKENINGLKERIASISDKFKKTFPISLRHKIAAHIDGGFRHTDFTSAYIMPELVPKYQKVISELKNIFFEFSHYDRYDEPFCQIKKQSDEILKNIE